jgi:hypothetical protein
MSLYSPETDDRDGTDQETPATCHGCDGFVNDDPAEYRWYGGWLYCLDCFYAIAGVQDDLKERDTFNEVRR